MNSEKKFQAQYSIIPTRNNICTTLVDLEIFKFSLSYRSPFEFKFLLGARNSMRHLSAKNQLELLSTTPRTNILYLILYYKNSQNLPMDLWTNL